MIARTLGLVVMLVLLAGLTGCDGSDSEEGDERAAGSGSGGTQDAGTGERFPSVLEVTAVPTGEQTFTFQVTISSPYDSPTRYADGWRILTPDGEEIGEHELLHDHANEQPFTREQLGVVIPPPVSEVVVEPRDSENGYGGDSKRVELPDR